MPPAVLATKLFVPPPRPGSVPRDHLVTGLQEGLHRPLTLVSAPAGFGKTSLLAAWVARCGRAAAWLSLDEADGEPARFLAHLVAALRTVAPGVGEGVLTALDAPRLPPVPALLTPLINDLSALPEPLLLVLDDYHAIDGRAVDEALAFLVEHLPPRLHLALATREDPPLPLARLRASGQLTELRATELRFGAEEAADFLNHAMGLELSAAQVAALERRTEGWIAGLQMAALSLQGRSDAEAFIDGFTGSHRFVLDYLADEVLQRQSAAVRAFLLRTSLPERLCGPLCDALAGDSAAPGQATLEAFERADLLLVPLDEERIWYRYHHLFADVLRATLQRERPDELPELHRRASAWHERNGFAAEAIQHAFAAGDVARAADLAEATWREMDRSYRSGVWLGWAQALPDEIVRARPLLAAGIAWALLDAGEMENAEPRLADAERWLAAHGSAAPPDAAAGRVAVDAAELRRLPAMVASGRAYHARGMGDAAASAEHARRALELLPGDDPFERGLARLLLGCALWAGGDLAGARAAVADAADDMWTAGNAPFAISFGSYLADVVVAQGRLGEAQRTLLRILERARDAGGGQPDETAVLHLALAEIHHERGEDDEVDRHLAAAAERGEQPAFPPWQRHWSPARARRLAARGDPEGALAELAAGERIAYRHAVPDVRPLAAATARLQIRLGRLAEARAWAEAQGVSTTDAPAYLREYEHLTLARLLVAEARRGGDPAPAEAAADLLARLLPAAEAGGREGSAIEILALQALARDAAGADDALEPLTRALARAAPGGWVRLFLDEGAPMLRLLAAGVARGIPGAERLLEAARGSEEAAPERPPPTGRPPVPPLTEPLSARELEALRLIAQGLSNREVGARLHRALDTVKGYTRRIYGKLGVRNRTEAVARARALGLLDE